MTIPPDGNEDILVQYIGRGVYPVKSQAIADLAGGGTPVTIDRGGTGAATAGGALDNLLADSTIQPNPQSFLRTGAATYLAQNVYGVNLDIKYLRNWRAARNAVATGHAAANTARVLFIGDSTTVGKAANYASTGDWKTNGYIGQLSRMLNTAGINAHFNSFIGSGNGFNNATFDPRITVGAGWAADAIYPTAGGQPYTATGATSSLSFLPTVNVDTFNLFVLKISGFGTITYNINGGSASTFSENGANNTILTLTKTGSLTASTLNVDYVSGGKVSLVGVEAYDSSKSWISLINAGSSSSRSVDWAVANNPYSPANCIGIYAPVLTSICLGINDWAQGGGTDITTFIANIQLLITNALAIGDCMLVAPAPSAISVKTLEFQQTYIAALYSLAVLNNIPLIDFFSRLTSYEISNPIGYYFDTLHPNGTAYGDQATAIFNLLMS